MHAVDPVRASTSVQSALPRDQTIYICAPDGIGMAVAISSTKVNPSAGLSLLLYTIGQ
jgi:hypothetical protein